MENLIFSNKRRNGNDTENQQKTGGSENEDQRGPVRHQGMQKGHIRTLGAETLGESGNIDVAIKRGLSKGLEKSASTAGACR